MRRQRLRAFTLVESIVTVGIVGLLVAILLPAVQKARVSAQRNECAHNLKTIAFACQSYHSTNSTLPPGFLGVHPKNEAGGNAEPAPISNFVGVLAFLLPYIEQDSLYSEINFGWSARWFCTIAEQTKPVALAAEASSVPNIGPAQAVIKTFLCPANSTVAPPVGTKDWQELCAHYWCGGPTLPDKFSNYPEKGYSLYGINNFLGGCCNVEYPESTFDHSSPPPSDLSVTFGMTDYVGVQGPAGKGPGSWGPIPANTFPIPVEQYTGVFYNRSATAFSQIADGTSNTLLFGESLGLFAGQQKMRAYTWMGSNFVSTFSGILTPADIDGTKIQDTSAYGQVVPDSSKTFPSQGFSSFHNGIVNFAMCDGSVRQLKSGSTWKYLAGTVATNYLPVNSSTPPSDWFVLQALAGKTDGNALANEAP